MEKSIIKTLDENGKITENAVYTINPKSALIAYLEQTINRNFNSWLYNDSLFLNSVKQFASGKGYGYNVPNKNISIAAYNI